MVRGSTSEEAESKNRDSLLFGKYKGHHGGLVFIRLVFM